MVQNNLAPPSKRDSKLLGKTSTPLVLKVEGTERDGQIIRVHAPKCLVGSGEDCQLRLIAADVQPKHCVIYRGPTGMVVKSWTRDTRVNGTTISEAWLRIGDQLSLGSLSFQVLADQLNETTTPAEAALPISQSHKALRRRSNRRIRNLLDMVRQQKDSFQSLQAKFDEAQNLVDSLLARESETEQTSLLQNEQLRADRRQLRLTKHNRVRGLLSQVRELTQGNGKLQAELREQLEIKQNQLNELRQQLAASDDATEAERSQQRRLEADLAEAKQMIGHLKEQATELTAREDQLRGQWQLSRKHANARVKSILAHLRQTREQIAQASEDEEDGNGAVSRLTELRLAYDEASRELQENRSSLKEAESELAWSQEELQDREGQVQELNSKIAEMELQLAKAQQACEHAENQEETSQFEGEVTQLQQQLEDASLRGDNLQRQLDELRQQNQELHETIVQQKQIEADWKDQLEEARQQCLAIRRQLEEERRNASSPHSADEAHTHEEQEEAAMDHLRSMGILRETPSHDEFERPDPQPSRDERKIDPKTGLTSYPNFQFPEEDELEESDDEPAYAPPQPPKQVAHSDDDVSIDDYMQSLLARMRAKHSGEPESHSKVEAQKKSETKHVPVEERVEEDVSLITSEEFIPSRSAPEQTSDIRRLRELANEQAKAAIDSATLNRWELLCKSKLAVSLVALMAGLFLNYLSPSYLSTAFAGACLAYVVTVFWWLQSAVIYQHVKKHRRDRMEKRLSDEIVSSHELAHHGEFQLPSAPTKEDHAT
ncbi:FHA domain-containing protein [Bremerella sp. JC817]|uniref:FHA domain-containing protein n=1 Tax=Bremerella sp. JC817 TaxID=3231756 RepID=UPI00345B08BB